MPQAKQLKRLVPALPRCSASQVTASTFSWKNWLNSSTMISELAGGFPRLSSRLTDHQSFLGDARSLSSVSRQNAWLLRRRHHRSCGAVHTRQSWQCQHRRQAALYARSRREVWLLKSGSRILKHKFGSPNEIGRVGISANVPGAVKK